MLKLPTGQGFSIYSRYFKRSDVTAVPLPTQADPK